MKLNTITVPAAILTLALAAPLAAQTPSPSTQPASPASPAAQSASRQSDAKGSSVQGELLRVDMDKKMVVIEGADGKEQSFRFDDDTEITGAAQNVEGLATKTGTRVTVEFEGAAASAVAKKISIQAAAATSPASPSSTSPAAPRPSSPAPSPSPSPSPAPAPRP
jgi:hypothetical protein